MSAGLGEGGAGEPIINAKYTLILRKNNKSSLLLMGKPFDNKPCGKYQRHNFNKYVKRHKILFLESEFRNTQKTTLASYKSSISSFLLRMSMLMSAFLPDDFHLWCHNRPTNPENMANCYGNDAALIWHLNLLNELIDEEYNSNVLALTFSVTSLRFLKPPKKAGFVKTKHHNNTSQPFN